MSRLVTAGRCRPGQRLWRFRWESWKVVRAGLFGTSSLSPTTPVVQFVCDAEEQVGTDRLREDKRRMTAGGRRRPSRGSHRPRVEHERVDPDPGTFDPRLSPDTPYPLTAPVKVTRLLSIRSRIHSVQGRRRRRARCRTRRTPRWRDLRNNAAWRTGFAPRPRGRDKCVGGEGPHCHRDRFHLWFVRSTKLVAETWHPPASASPSPSQRDGLFQRCF
jgi:hypothetical protein